MTRADEALTIVVGYDGSAAARRAVSRVGDLAAHDRTVVLVAVAPSVGSSMISQEPLVGGDFDAEKLLREAAQLLAETESTTVETRSASGDPAQVLIDLTREVGADLLIVGRRGSDFVARTLLGSVAERVIQRAGCDVLVVA